MGRALVVVKVGGSIVTDKERPFKPDLEAMRTIAGVLAEAPARLVVVVGGGSYGHAAVRLAEEAGAEAADAIATVALVMQELAGLFAEALAEAGLAPLVYPPHSLCSPRGLRPNCNWAPVAQGLLANVTPLIYGDVYPLPGGYAIVSGDELAAEAACKLRAERLVYLTTVEGVLGRDGRPIPRITRWELEELLGAVGGAERGVDVTGGMRRKLAAIAANACPGLRVVIAYGRSPEKARKALLGRDGGTTILL